MERTRSGRPTRRALLVMALLTGSAALSLQAVGVSASPLGPPAFDSGRILSGQGGGEPSLAVDTSPVSRGGDIYVEAIGGWGSTPPKHDAKGAGPVIWHSYNGGRSWSAPVPFDLNGPARGGDGDVVVAPNGNVIVTDLNVSHTWVQVSTDQGREFNNGTATAPEDDRPWLTAAANNVVYVAYHDFVAEIPVVCTSTDGGRTFPTCNPMSLTGPNVIVQCAENTIPARPLSVDPTNGSLNFLFSCSTAAENAANPPYGTLHDYYLAQSTDGGTTWSDYPVFIADASGGKNPNYANIFSTLGIDSRGNYYVVFAGTSDDHNPKTHPYHVYLVTSRNHGHSWSRPVQVDPGPRGTHTEPHFVVTSPGNVDVVYYGTSATGEPNGYCGSTIENQVKSIPCKDGFARFDNPHPKPPLQAPPPWYVYMSQSHNALSAHPTFTATRVTRQVIHWGEICTDGIVCGNSDRSLLDFISVGVDCRGYAHLAYAGNTIAEEKADFNNGGANIHESNQVGGTPLAPPAACGARPRLASGFVGGGAGWPTGLSGLLAATAFTMVGAALISRRRTLAVTT